MPNRSEMMTPKPPVEFTPERKELFLAALRECGYDTLSAEAAGVSPRTVQDHKKRDPEFAARCIEAKDANTDELAKEAYRRAFQGVETPVIGGKFKDEIVTHIQVYSDSLTQFLLKSRRDEFKGVDKSSADQGRVGGVMVVPAKGMTVADWESGYGELAKGNTGRPAAPPPPGHKPKGEVSR